MDKSLNFIFTREECLTDLSLRDFLLILVADEIKNLDSYELLNKSHKTILSLNKSDLTMFEDCQILPRPIQIRVLLKNMHNLTLRTTLIHYYDDFCIDMKTRTVIKNDQTARLTELEVNLFKYLLDHNGQYKKSDLLAKIWNYKHPEDLLKTSVVDISLVNLRKKLDELKIKI